MLCQNNKVNKKRGFTFYLIFLSLSFAIYFAFMRQTNELLELSMLQRKIATQMKKSDLGPLKRTAESVILLENKE